MSTPSEPPTAADVSNDVTDEGVFQTVQDGYDAVYGVLERSATFNHIWRTKAYREEFPEEFAHIGFLTLGEARRMIESLGLTDGSVLVDVACGAGGPGLWAARETGASLIGIDPATAGVTAARERACRVGLQDHSRFEQGTFEHTGLADASAEGAMTIEAFQYAPDKRAALRELFRILRPGGMLAIICFEVDPAKADGLPILGVDPVPDYRPLLKEAGFTVELYEETPGWQDRVYGVFQAIVDASDILTQEMGERAAAGAIAEALLTVAMRPYPRRILAIARRPS